MSANMGEDTSPFVDQLADGPGGSRIDPSDPAAPMYRLLALMRSPVALRDLMISRFALAIIRSSTTTMASRRSCVRPALRRSSILSARGCRTVSISFPECSSRATKSSRLLQNFLSGPVWPDPRKSGKIRLSRAVDRAGRPLAFPLRSADIGGGRLAVDEPLANRVRSGRKQP